MVTIKLNGLELSASNVKELRELFEEVGRVASLAEQYGLKPKAPPVALVSRAPRGPDKAGGAPVEQPAYDPKKGGPNVALWRERTGVRFRMTDEEKRTFDNDREAACIARMASENMDTATAEQANQFAERLEAAPDLDVDELALD